MKKLILLAISILFLLVSCKNTSNPDVEKLKSKYAVLLNQTLEKNFQKEYKNNSNRGEVMLQGFTWESHKENGTWWDTLAAAGSEIGTYFDYVWFPPVSDSESANGYMPRELYNLNSAYGSEESLKNAIAAIYPAKAVADVVINHRSGSTSWGDFQNPTWETVKGENYKAISSSDEGFANDDFMMMVAENMRGNKDTGDNFVGCRDLDHTNPVVQQGIIDWMKKLRDFGFAGWRFDYAKGYSPSFVGYYNQAVETDFAVGEYWVDDSGKIQKWINKTETSLGAEYPTGKKTMAFDFRLKSILNHVFGKKENQDNKNFQLLGFNDSIMKVMPEYAVTFVENHDTGSTQSHWPIDSSDLGTAYAFLLTHPGIPCVSYEHYGTETADGKGDWIVSGTEMTLHNHINYLITLRKICGITNTSALEVEKVEPSVYKATVKGENANIILIINPNPKTNSVPKGYKAIYSGDIWTIYTNL